METSSTHIHTVVLPGGKIELDAPPHMHEGDEVDVLMVAAPRPGVLRSSPTVLDVLDSLPEGLGRFKSADEADAYLRNERDSWER